MNDKKAQSVEDITIEISQNDVEVDEPFIRKEIIGLSLDNVIGNAETKKILRDTILNPRYNQARSFIPMDPWIMLLLGPPNCGKGFFVNAIASELGAPIFNFRSDDVTTSIRIGGNEHEKFLEEALKLDKSIICFEDMENMVEKENPSLEKYEFLQKVFDRVTSSNRQGGFNILICIVSRPDILEHLGYMLPLSFQTIYFGPPDMEEREEFLRRRLDGRLLGGETYLKAIASKTENYSYRDLSRICMEIDSYCDERAGVGHYFEMKPDDIGTILDKIPATIDSKSLDRYTEFLKLVKL